MARINIIDNSFNSFNPALPDKFNDTVLNMAKNSLDLLETVSSSKSHFFFISFPNTDILRYSFTNIPVSADKIGRDNNIGLP